MAYVSCIIFLILWNGEEVGIQFYFGHIFTDVSDVLISMIRITRAELWKLMSIWLKGLVFRVVVHILEKQSDYEMPLTLHLQFAGGTGK